MASRFYTPFWLTLSLPLNRMKKNLPWQNGLFEESMRSVGVTGIEVGTTVYVTNLDQGVTNEDIRV